MVEVIFGCLGWVIAGACMGSFLNVLVYRLPRRESIVSPPSHCPRCGHLIRWYDNVPVFGWIKLWGKCRDCRTPISVRYPCVEGLCGFLFGSVFVLLGQYGLSCWLFIAWTLLFSFLGIGILATCLIIYDKKNNKIDT